MMVRQTSLTWKQVLLFGILFLFFFQLLADFIEAIYAFGLMGTSIPPEIVSVLFLFTPILLFLWRKSPSSHAMMFLGMVVLLARVIEPLLDTRSRMLTSGVGVGAFLMFFPSLFGSFAVNLSESDRKREEKGKSWAFSTSLGVGLTFGVVLSILLRVLGSGLDLSTQGWYQAIGWLLGVGGAVLLMTQFTQNDAQLLEEGQRCVPFGKVLAFSLGITSVWIMLYFAFASPNVIARWTGAPYFLVILLLGLTFSGFVLLLTFRSRWLEALSPSTLVLLNVLFVLTLVFTLLPHQLKFPDDPSGYPFYEPPTAPLASVPLVLMLLLAPLILLNFMFLVQEIVLIQSNHRTLAGAFSICSLYLLLVIFAQVFTTVYDYIPVVGPFFRDRFWMVYLVIGVVLTLSLLFLHVRIIRVVFSIPKSLADSILVSLMVTILAVPILSAKPTPMPVKSSLCVLTYNIQQGYSEDGRKNHAGQLEVIREVDADVIGLQESDTNRISGGNSDIVRYFADHLDVYSYYGPKVVTGTFGIALLSKYPIQNPRTFYMYSEGEQTATIRAQITIGEQTFNLFVTHLGNDGPIEQQQALLKEVEGLPNVIAMGDFNFRPDTEQYQLTRTMLEDAWLLRWPSGIDDQGFNPVDRIDHIFVSSGIRVAEARYIVSTASDHPAMVVEIVW